MYFEKIKRLIYRILDKSKNIFVFLRAKQSLSKSFFFILISTLSISTLAGQTVTETVIDIPEIVVKPGKLRKAGAIKTARGAQSQAHGWILNFTPNGLEIGLKLDLGELPVLVKKLHVRVRDNSFDSCLFRLHVRNIVDELPGNELLTQNIFVTVTKRSGWVVIDLSKYNLVFQGEIFLSLELLETKGINKNRLVTLHTSDGKEQAPNFSFNGSTDQFDTYSKMSSGSQWKKTENGTVNFYLTIM